MTEMMLREDRTALNAYQPDLTVSAPAVRDLVQWVEQAQAAHTLAVTLCKTAFVPAHFRNKPDDTAAAILTGHELGMSPLAAVRSIFIIAGTPGMYAKAMVAVLQSKGHDVWVVEQSDDKVVVRGQRKGSEHVHETTWDRARVVKAKLVSNAKYQESPQQMMVARGQAEICRQVASDALHGIPYAIEETEYFEAEAAQVAAPRVTKAEILGTPPAAIEQHEHADAELVDEPPVAMMAEGQKRKLFAICAELGDDRERRLTRVSMILGRDVETTRTLTRFDAGTVLDALDAEVARRRREQYEAAQEQPPADEAAE